MFKPTIFLDFDNTITPKYGIKHPPLPETIEAINKLSEHYSIIIFSCRGNPVATSVTAYEEMLEYLILHNIPYDGIFNAKPAYAAIIDDKSYNPTKDGWASVLNSLIEK